MSVAALNLLATAKPELLWERKQEAAAVRENKQNITNTLLPAPLLLMSKARSMSLTCTDYWGGHEHCGQCSWICSSGQDPAPTGGAERQLRCATKEIPLALFYMLE